MVYILRKLKINIPCIPRLSSICNKIQMINSWPLSPKLVSSVTCHCDWINYLMHFKFLGIASWPRLRIPNSFLITRWGWSELCQFLFPQFNSVTQLCLTLCDPMDYSTQAFAVHHHSRSLFKLISIKSVILSTISSSVVPFSFLLQSFPNQGLFQWVSSSPRWPKDWSFSFSISLFKEYSGLIS